MADLAHSPRTPSPADHHLLRLGERFLKEIQDDLAADRLALPSLPDVAMRVQRAVQDPATSREVLCRVIATDPPLSVQLLRVANSAFYRGAKQVSDLQRAVVRLGDRVVHHIVMLLVVSELYQLGARPALSRHLAALWHHSTLVATLSDLICRRHTPLHPETALLAGLVHDIGVVPVLLRAESLPSVMGNPRLLRALVRAVHCQVGAALLRHWDFPQELVAVALEHENLHRDNTSLVDYVDIVLVANRLSRSGALPVKEGDTPLPAQERLGLGEEEAEDLLRYATAEGAKLRLLLNPDTGDDSTLD